MKHLYSSLLGAALLLTLPTSAQPAKKPLPEGYQYITMPESVPIENLHLIRCYETMPDGSKQQRYGFADDRGEIVVEPIYFSGIQFNEEGYATVSKYINGELREGLIDHTARVVIPCNYSKVFPPKSGFIRFAEGNGMERRYGYMNLQGEELIAPAWYFAADFSDGLAAVRNTEGKYGYIDTTGRVVIQPLYDEARDFTEGCAVVGKADKYYNQLGLINRTGEVMVPLNCYAIGSVRNGRVMVSRIVDGKERFGQMSLDGKQTLRCEWDYVSDFKFGHTWVGLGEYPDCRYVMLDAKGNETTYDDYYDLNDSSVGGYYSAAIRDAEGNMKYGVLDQKGTVLIPFKYDRVTIYTHHHPTRGDLERVMLELNGETTGQILGDQ